MKKPDFILVGESRCGSTALYEALIKHPDIYLPTPESTTIIKYENGTIDLSQKELRFFDRHWDKGVDWYFNRFSGTLCGDASATYLYHPYALERIKNTTPDSKIIILLRNPVDRVRSHFYHALKINGVTESVSNDFDQYIKKELQNKVDLHHMIKRGIYVQSVKRCLDLFDKTQVLILKSEDLFTCPIETIQKVINFLNVNSLFRRIPLDFVQLRQSSWKQPSEETQQLLYDFYRPHNDELYQLLETDFKWG